MCSVLFADLVGFTPLSEARDPEEVRELLSQYFDTARTVIGRYGGVVEKFIGDAVMAVWGTPVAGEDDAERAVRAGLDLAAAVTLLGEQAGIPGLAARVGIVTGEVAVNLGATNQGMVAGDAVNTASRVQSVAAPGAVWVDEATHRLAAPAIGFHDAGHHSLKGKAEPVPLYSATRVLSGVGGAQRVDGLEAPLLGRDPELRTVRELFHGTVDRKAPRLVLVSGPAGVGKSRLGWEFEKYVDGLADQIWWHRGRCLSYGDGVVFWALAEIVRQRLSIAEEDPTDVAARKLADGLTEFLPDDDERGYVSLRLGRLLGVPVTDDPGTALSREELFAGWRLFFERLAATGPVVLLVEDAQYADPGLLDFLDHLVDWARGVPIFVLVFARPELEHSHPNWVGGRNRTMLALDPLDPRSMDELVGALVPGMPATSRDVINGQAQGIPLFAVETIRSLIDRDIVVPRDGVYRLVGDIGALAVPDSLHALLAARLDALDPELRSLVADAAVLGSTFPVEALVAVSDRDEHSVRRGLAELLRREVLEISADKLSPQRGSYRFAQNLLRQVAYDTLSRRDRKARHLAVAAHLRAAFPGDGDEVIDAIATHYRDALDAVPDDPDVEQIRDEAVNALVRAAQRALRAGAPAGAATNFSTAAHLRAESASTEASMEAGALWEAAAEAEQLTSDTSLTTSYAETARECYLAAGDRRSAARADAIAGGALRSAYRLAEARERLTADLAILREDPDESTAIALAELGMVQVVSDDPEAASTTAQALELGQLVGASDTTMCTLLTNHALGVNLRDRPVEAIALLEHAARLAERNSDSAGLGRVLLNLCYVVAPWDQQAALDAARASVEHCRRVGADQYLITAVGNLADSLIWFGDWDGAAAALADAGLAFDAEALPLGNYYALLPVAQLAGLRGDPAVDKDIAVLESRIASDDATSAAQLMAIRAMVAEGRGQVDEALRFGCRTHRIGAPLGLKADFLGWSWPVAARAAYELRETEAAQDLLGMMETVPAGRIPPLLRVQRDIARARLASDHDPNHAAALFTDGLRGLRRLGSPYHLAHGLLDQAEYELSRHDASGSNRTDSAAPLIAEARQIAERLGAAPLAARAERLSHTADTVIGTRT